MLELPNLVKDVVEDVMGRLYEVITFILNTFISRRPGLANSADIIKIAITSIKPFKVQENTEESQIMYQNTLFIFFPKITSAKCC